MTSFSGVWWAPRRQVPTLVDVGGRINRPPEKTEKRRCLCWHILPSDVHLIWNHLDWTSECNTTTTLISQRLSFVFIVFIPCYPNTHHPNKSKELKINLFGDTSSLFNVCYTRCKYINIYTFVFGFKRHGHWERVTNREGSTTGDIYKTKFTNRTMHLSHIPQYSNQNKNVHIFVLDGALCHMEQVHCGICEIGLFVRLATNPLSNASALTLSALSYTCVRSVYVRIVREIQRYIWVP